MAFFKSQKEFNKTFGSDLEFDPIKRELAKGKKRAQMAGQKARKAKRQSMKDAMKAKKRRSSFLHTIAKFKTKYIK